MATIDSNGITIQTLSEWKATLEGIYHAVDPEWDLSANTPDGQVVAAFSEMLANADEGQLDSYNAADPDKATGEALTAIMRISNVKKKEGTYSTATVQLSGTQNTSVPADTLIENNVTGTRWAVTDTVVLGAGPTNASVVCTTVGAQTAGVGELSKIATPVSGLQSVTNSTSATVGRNPMTDPEAREYREETIAKPAINTIDAIHSAVAIVDGVTHVRVYNNRTASDDSMGIPGRSFAAIVAGGDDMAIAKAIYSKLGPGPGMFGGANPVSVTVQSDKTQNEETVTFGRPLNVPLYVNVAITETGEMPDNAVTEIKAALVAFSQGNLFDNDVIVGHRKTPFQIGENISSGLLHTPVNYYLGKAGQGYVTSIFLSDSPNPAASGTVIVGWNALASITEANIEVSIT